MNPLLTIVSNFGGIAAASVFTTLSATNWMEQAKTAVDSGASSGDTGFWLEGWYGLICNPLGGSKRFR
jgi:hypothetical protein